MGRAFSEILTTELVGWPGAEPIPPNRMHALNPVYGPRSAALPGISAERTLALASGASQIGYGDYAVHGGRLEVQLTIEDLHTGKMRQLATSAPSTDVAGAAFELARQIFPHAVPYHTRSTNALKAWAVALETGNPDLMSQSLESAIAADPDFGPPYRMLAQLKSQRQDRAGALALLDQALARGDRMPPAERASIELESATLRDDPVKRLTALNALVKLEPRDANVWRSLAEAAFRRRDYPLTIQSYQKSLELEPDNVNAWNQLGYAFAFSGELDGALGALQHYQALRPTSSDPIDSQGDVQLILGHLKEAEDLYLQAARKAPGYPNAPDLFKAAMARLMTGDVAGADGIAKQYIDARRNAHDVVIDYFEAEWQWVSGRRKAAYQQLASFAESIKIPELASGAHAELAIWSLCLGDHAAAEQIAQKSAPPTGQAPPLAILARYLAQPAATPAEWSARAERIFANPTGREAALSYALLLNREFDAAVPVLKQIQDHTSPASDDMFRVLLAWSEMEAGKPLDASLLQLNPVPPLTGTGPLVSLYFPRIFYLRAVAASKEGKADVARANYRLFLQLSGPDPLMWGEEQKARSAQ